MNEIVWEDITDEATEAAKGLKLFGLINCEGFVLEDSMQANEANDPRVDTKANLSQACHLQHLLQNKIVRHPNDISKSELISLYDEVLGYEAQAMTNQPIAHSIYRFPYIYDLSLCRQTPLVEALAESVITLGGYCAELVHNGCTVKEDDIFYSQMAFSSSRKSHDEVVQMLLKAEKTLDSKKKGNQVDAALLVRIKFRRFLHILCKNLGLKFDPKNQDKILKDIESCNKRLEELAAQGDTPAVDGVFNGDLFRTLRSHISPRVCVPINRKHTITTFTNMLEQFKLFLSLPNSFTQIVSKLQKLSLMPLNTLSKSYFFCNFIIMDEPTFMRTISKATVLSNDMFEWSAIKQSVIKSQKFKTFLEQVTVVFDDVLYRMLGNRVRWYRECSKSYQSLNLAVHLANQLDSQLSEGKKEMLVCSWVYYVGINLMIKQLHVGIEIEIYYSNQLPYIFFYLEYLLNISEKNSGMFLRKFDKTYINSFYEKTLDHKKQKKVSSTARRMFASIVFNKGLLLYYRGLYKLLMIFLKYGALKGSLESTEVNRYNGRFHIFKKVLFTKYIDYETYRKQYEATTSEQALTKSIQMAQDSLKQAKNMFQLIQALEGCEVTVDAELLMKICIKTSLQVMKFKMNRDIAKTLKFVKNHPNYPEFMFG